MKLPLNYFASFVYAFYPTIPGSSPKHTINAFII